MSIYVNNDVYFLMELANGINSAVEFASKNLHANCIGIYLSEKVYKTKKWIEILSVYPMAITITVQNFPLQESIISIVRF